MAGVLLATNILSAETYTATGSVTDWNDPTLWGAPQMAGNDFVFAGTASFHRVTATSSSFDGDSLTIRGPGSLTAGAYNIDQDLILESYGVFSNGNHNSVHTGTWTIVDNAVFEVRRPKSTLDITLEGEGVLWLGDGLTGNSTIVLSAAGCSSFAGTIIIGVPSEDDVVNLEFDGDVNAPDLSIKIDAFDNGGTIEYSHLDLSHTLAVGAVELDGVALEPGVYDFSDLTTDQQLFFIDNGGQLVVSPPDAPTGTLIEVSTLAAPLENSAS